MAMSPAARAVAVKRGLLKPQAGGGSGGAPTDPTISALAKAYLTDPQIKQQVNAQVHAAITPQLHQLAQSITDRTSQGNQVARDDVGVYGAVASKYAGLGAPGTPVGNFGSELAGAMAARGAEEAGFAKASTAHDVGVLQGQRSDLLGKAGDLRTQATAQLHQQNFSNAITAETLLGKQAVDQHTATIQDAGITAQWGLTPQQIVGMSPGDLNTYLRSTHRGPYATKPATGQLTAGQKADFTAKYGVSPTIFNSWGTGQQQDYLKAHNLGPWAVKGKNGGKKGGGLTPNELAGYANQFDSAYNFAKTRYPNKNVNINKALYNIIHEPSSGGSQTGTDPNATTTTHSSQSGGTMSALLAQAAAEKWFYGGVTGTTWQALRKRYPGIRGQLKRGHPTGMPDGTAGPPTPLSLG